MKSKNKIHGIMEKSDININLVDINDLSSLLTKSGYLEKFSFTEGQTDILNYSNMYYQILYDSLEFDEDITVQEITKKYGRLLSSINTNFNVNSTFKELFKQYVYYTKANISLNIFLNWLIILDLIFTNFKNIFDDSLDNLIHKKINLFNIDLIYSGFDNNNQNIDKLDTVYEKIKKQPQFLNKKVESDLIILIYIISFENKIIYDEEITNPSNIIKILELYNKIYISDVNISLLIYIGMIILINISLYFNKNKKIPFEQNINDKNSQKEKSSNNRKSSANFPGEVNSVKSSKNEIPNLCLFDDEIKLTKDINEESVKVFLFQNCLKLYTLCHLSKNKIKLTINLSIQNINELINKINIYSREEEESKFREIEERKPSIVKFGPFAPNNIFEENLKNYIQNNKLKNSRNQIYDIYNKIDSKDIRDKNIKRSMSYGTSFFLSMNEDQEQFITNIKLNNIKIMTQNNLNIALNNYVIDDLLIKFINTMNSSDVKKLNTNYQSLISCSNSCFLQESIISFIQEEANNIIIKTNNEIINSSVNIKPEASNNLSKTQILNNLNNNVEYTKENIIDNLSIKDFFKENEILDYFLDYYSHLDNKKLPKIIQIKFHTFKCNINQQNKTIQIFYNFSKIKEKVLFEFLKEVKNMDIFIKKYQTIIKSLKEFKLYQVTIRVSQTNFRSHQLNYIFNILTHKIVDFIEDNSYNKIMIYETQLNNYDPNMKVYLRDFSLKKKNLTMVLKIILFKSPFFNKIKFIIEYLSDLVEQWDLIVLSDNEKDIKLLKSFEDNKLFIFFLKEKEFNANKNLVSMINNKNNNNKNNNNDDNKKKIKNISQKHKKDKDADNKNQVYEYLNFILYIKNSIEDYVNILKTMESFLTNKNFTFDFKTNLICDRIFFEENIMNDSKLQNIQISVLNLIDDFFLVTKTNSSFNKENIINQNKPKQNKITKTVINEYYNYDFFIGDDFVGVLNNHLYDLNQDLSNNFSNLIYDFLSVLSSCLEFIYFILKIKSIFILRFIYIIHTKNNCYYSLEIKNWSFFVKKMTDFSSLFSANIKISKPLFCLLKQKTKSNVTQNIEEAIEDNFYDIFLRLFLNLNKVFKNKELNKEFFKKLHKNIFKDYQYDLVAFSYEAFLIFNEIFIKNNYLKITKGEKFENCYIIPSEGFFDKTNYRKILNLIESKDSGKDNDILMAKNILVFNFGLDYNYLFKNKENALFGISKINYFINQNKIYVHNTILDDNKKKKDLLKKKFEEKKTNKKNIHKYLNLIEQFQLGKYHCDENNKNNKVKFEVYNPPIYLYNSIIKDYTKQKIMIQTQKNELNVFQNEEKNSIENKNNENDYDNDKNQKECIIF